MTGMLASVNSIAEVQLVLDSSVDIIDLKNPEQGALGALSNELVTEIVAKVNHKKLVSATVGDLPMQANIIFNAVSAMLDTGVDYIKIGFFPDGDWLGTVSKLTEITQQGHQLIAVLFADTQPDISIIQSLKTAGFSGVMLDTMDKSTGGLSQVIALSRIRDFVITAKDAHLLCGLAGSLKVDDIPALLSLNADYLGFRGALCEQHNRTAQLDKHAVNSILSYFE
jgi:uncharacterized protein (UPF0264 family)